MDSKYEGKAIKMLTKARMLTMLSDIGLPTSGNKPALEKRLRDYYRSEPKNDCTVKDDMKLGESASTVGSTSSVRSQRVLNAAKINGLKVKIRAKDAEQQIRRKQEQLRLELEELQLHTELDILQAEEETLSEYGTRREQAQAPQPTNSLLQPTNSLLQPTNPLLQPTNSLLQPTNPLLEPTNSLLQPINPLLQPTNPLLQPINPPLQSINPPLQLTNPLLQQQQQMLDLMSLPKPHLVTFNGDPLKYHIFMNMFDSCVHSANISESAKLNRLFELCKDNAFALIEPCALMPPDRGYTRARQLLATRFGDDFEISEAYVNKIMSGSPIKGNDIRALQKFTDDVRACTETLKAMGRINEVDTRSRLVKLVEKLPFHLQNRWRADAFNHREITGSYPGIERFLAFIERATREMSDPVFGIKESAGTNSFKPEKPRNSGTAFTVQANVKPDWGNNKIRPAYKCEMCDQGHPIYMCEAFKKLAPNDRVKKADEKHLCYNCLKFGRHSAKDCRSDRKCNFHGCQEKHSYLLHEALSNINAPNTEMRFAQSFAVATPKKPANQLKIAMPIVPVYVRGSANDKVIKTFALLDSGSNMTFCSQGIIDELNVSGKPHDIALSTLNAEKQVRAVQVELNVSGTSDECQMQVPVKLKNVFAIHEFPNLIANIATKTDLQTYTHLRDLPVPEIGTSEVTMLIGQDNPHALVPTEIRRGKNTEPYALKTQLGWTINGPINCNETGSSFYAGTDDNGVLAAVCNFVSRDDELQHAVERFWKIDSYATSKEESLSVNDKRVLEHWDNSACLKDGRYELEIPFKDKVPQLPDNKPLAERRLEYLGKRLQRNENQRNKYAEEINSLVEKGYAEKVTDKCNSPGMTWYIPHHAVFNVNKPDKLRVVYDCSAVYNNVSLNKSVLQGPDMTNKLVGVLLRFRENPVAIMSDVQTMFYQIVVPERQRDVLRFLWWRNDDPNNEIEIYRMTRHVFGGIWCSSAATYALRKTANDNKTRFDTKLIDAAINCFYVDDMLCSVTSEDEAINVAQEMINLCKLGGFNLTKWMSNSKRVLANLPGDKLAPSLQNLDVDVSGSALPRERALGLEWNADVDTLQVSVKTRDAVLTRRGLLSYVSSVYDPLGFVSPFVLTAKKLFQKETKLNKNWDDPLECSTVAEFEKWLKMLSDLKAIQISRCILPEKLDPEHKTQLHHFADASSEAYGTVSYIRAVDIYGKVHVSFVFGKSRLTPIKSVTIPRLELMAAVMAVNMDQMLKKELNLKIHSSYFWSDSTAVLGYIKNCDKKYDIFVANRLSHIQEHTKTLQWHHVPTLENPADDASRGITPKALNGRWLSGPEFLKRDEKYWPISPNLGRETDCLKAHQTPAVFSVDAKKVSFPQSIIDLFNRYSSFYKLKRAVAWLTKFIKWIRSGKVVTQTAKVLTLTDLEEAEIVIIKCEQERCFGSELRELKQHKCLQQKNAIYKLEPYIDDNAIIRVGGRLQNAPTQVNARNQILLPRESCVTTNIIRQIHATETKHAGTEHVLAILREKYWVPRARGRIKLILHKCVICKILYAAPKPQRMADLPPDRLAANTPPFTNVGVDCFGPYFVKRGRVQEKRYGCIFTCLVTRAVHIEVLSTLEADAFVNALMRFSARRGKPSTVRCDNATNFIGGSTEIKKSVCEWNRKVHENLLQQQIRWLFNPPTASHMGGVWERIIRSIRRILCALLRGLVLDDERLNTFMCEAESIINNRPITKNSDDHADAPPLKPNDLLLLRDTALSPPGVFTRADIYSRRWRHVQYLADRFWKRWSTEYIAALQHRQKWIKPMRNFQINDIVLMCDDMTTRNLWPLARVIQVKLGRDNHVRSVTVKTQNSVLTRPVNKLCLIEGA